MNTWPDTVVVETDETMELVIDIAVPGDIRVEEKEQEMIDKYQARELSKFWKV